MKYLIYVWSRIVGETVYPHLGVLFCITLYYYSLTFPAYLFFGGDIILFLVVVPGILLLILGYIISGIVFFNAQKTFNLIREFELKEISKKKVWKDFSLMFFLPLGICIIWILLIRFSPFIQYFLPDKNPYGF